MTDLRTLYLKKKYRQAMNGVNQQDIVEDVFFAPMPFRGIPIKHTRVVSVVHDVLQIPLDLYSEKGGLINTIKKYEYWFDLENYSKN